MDTEPIKVTVERNKNEKLSLSLPWDADAHAWQEAFEVILKWLTFTNDTIKGLFVEEW